MIAIVNTGPQTSDPGGWRNYQIKINQKVITTFKHKREHGLSVCLYKAAAAVMEKKQRS